VGKTFSTEKYGIGLKKDDTNGRKAVNDALEKITAAPTCSAAWSTTPRPSRTCSCAACSPPRRRRWRGWPPSSSG
ncbi:hypothetical protein AB0392_58180, partial [Nonomuraea angiospora]